MDYNQFRSQQHYFEADGGKIAYVDEGQGPTILLLHGFPTSSWLFRNAIPILVENGFRVIAPDLLGFGNSAKPKDPELYSNVKQTQRILALLRHLEIPTWIQVCHDLGGPWTWEMIDIEPEHIQKLIILNTTAYVDGWHIDPSIKLMDTPIGAVLMKLLGSKAIGPRLGKAMFDPHVGHPENLTPSAREGYWIPLREGATHTMRLQAGLIQTLADDFPRYQAAFKRVDIPVMIIWGKADQALDAEIMIGQFARDLNIAAENIHIFEDAKHFLWEDYPLEIAQLIADFAK